MDVDHLVVSRNKIECSGRHSVGVSRAGVSVRSVKETFDLMEEDEDEFDTLMISIETFECIIKESSSDLSLDVDYESYE